MDLRCTVSGFMDSLGKTDDVEVCTAATAWDDEEGRTFILVFGQGLWFGDRMPHKSLINPNQCRSYGISFCDDPRDPHRQLGIYDPVTDTNIPMRMNGSFASMDTRCPTEEELETCTKIYLSDEEHWNPSSPLNISMAYSQKISNYTTEIDRCLASISQIYDSQHVDGLARSLSEEVIISSTKSHDRNQKKTKAQCLKGKEIYQYRPPQPFIEAGSMFTDNRHHPPTAESLARKWNIGLKRAKATLKVTTQAGVRSALHPLTRRYRTNLTQLHYRRLNTTFYTDTMFVTTKSIQQNTCAQIWSNNKGFIHVDPLRSKADCYLSLNNLIDTVGIPNKVFSDGGAEQTGINTKL